MPKELPQSVTFKNTILVIIVVLISIGTLTLNLFAENRCRIIDEGSDSISFTYHADVGGWHFSYDSQYDHPWLRIKVKETGWYNLTYHYFNGDTESKRVYVCERSVKDVSVQDGTMLLQGEWSDGWLSINSVSSHGGEKFRVFRPDIKNLEKIGVNGEVGYVKTSLENINVDTGKIF